MQKGGRSDFIGECIGGAYEIVAKIGNGSFGDVYQAKHIFLEDNHIVALKLLHAHLNSQEARENFIREAQLLNKLQHPHILPFIAAGIHLDGMPYIVTEYASQGTLFDRLKKQQNQPLPLKEGLTILSQVSQGLQYAHQKNIVHRDLKPANILFNALGEVLLADFGIAVALPSEHTIRLAIPGGTPQYMAPEQFEGTTSMKSDIYALGCIAYEIFTAQKPITIPPGSDSVVWMHQHRTQVPIFPTRHNPAIPHLIEQMILKALAKQRDDRPDISTFLACLQSFVKAQIDTYVTNISPSNKDTTAKNTTLQKTPSLTLQKTARQCFDEGNRFYDMKHYSDAVATYEQAIRLSFKNSEVYVNKGNALGNLERYEEAVIAYTEAIRLNHEDANVYYNLANTYSNLARYRDAVIAYCQTTTLNEKHTNAYYNKGIALYKLKLYKEAITAYEQVIRLDSKHASAYYNKGNAYYCLERYQEAITAHEQAIRLDPKHANAYCSKGNACYCLELYKDAVIAYDQAIRLNPNHASAYHSKGDALEALGWSKEAQQAYEKAYQLGYTDK